MPYKKNYLARVIFQLRFDPLLVLEGESPGRFQEDIRARFPNLKVGQEIELLTQLSLQPETQANVRTTRPRWIFSAKDESRSLTVSSTMFSLEYTKYESMQATQDDFEFVWRKFRDTYQVDTLTRAGLRYIDKVARPSGNPLDWQGWISDRLLAATFAAEPPAGHKWARSMHALHWTEDDHRITLQFGIHNADEFPSPVVKREYVLDFDCSSVGAVEADEASACLTRYHGFLRDLFEQSIGDAMRADMNTPDGPTGITEGGD